MRGDLLKAIEAHAVMCADFGNMGTGAFVRKYPDYSLGREGGFGPEGSHYITRRADALAKLARSKLRHEDDADE